jgi:uncharacterized protein (TIGR04222 family)
MIPQAHRGLWRKIQDFPLDNPNATLNFTNKLASQQKWTIAYAKRVIREYRRFIFLCCISPKGASPSYAVDQAWHLHLTYTKSYWIDFCKNTLRKDIHHNPSSGGEAEDHKHENWYAETLNLYESTFGNKPPADIWPQAAFKHPVISLPEIKIRREVVVLIAFLLLLPFLYSAFTWGQWFPFLLDGHQFLQFFAFLAIIYIVGYIVLRREKRRAMDKVLDQFFPEKVSVFHAAQYLHGKHRAIQTSIVDMVKRELLFINDDQKFVVNNKMYHPGAGEYNPMVPALLKEDDRCELHYDVIANRWYRPNSFTQPVLERLDRFVKEQEPFLRKYLIIILAFIIGLVRVGQGLITGRPVSYLTAELFFFLIAMVLVWRVYGRHEMLFKKTENRYLLYGDQYLLPAHPAVKQYALQGTIDDRLLPFAAILSTIFAAYPVIIPPVKNTTVDGPYTTCGSCGSSCNSSGGDSGSCGGGGCGGCGGGGD